MWNDGRVVIGGSSSKNEMCEVHLWYYPRHEEFQACGSDLDDDEAMSDLGVEKFTYR